MIFKCYNIIIVKCFLLKFFNFILVLYDSEYFESYELSKEGLRGRFRVSCFQLNASVNNHEGMGKRGTRAQPRGFRTNPQGRVSESRLSPWSDSSYWVIKEQEPLPDWDHGGLTSSSCRCLEQHRLGTFISLFNR